VAPRVWHGPALIAYRLLLLAAVLATGAWALTRVWAFTIDDAGISYAYAKHIADGLGPVATPGGPRVEGYSNPLWVFLLIPVHWLGVGIPVAAKALGAAAFALALLAGSATVALADGRRAFALGAAEAAFALGCALCLEVVVWVPAGLENALFVAALLAMVLCDVRESLDNTRLPLSGLAAFALSITRPEGVMYAAPLVLAKLVAVWRRREAPRQALGAAASFVALLGVYHALHYLVFGELVANTYFAKVPGTSFEKGYQYLSTAARESGLVHVLPLAAIGLWGRVRQKLLLAWSVLAGVLFTVYAGGDWMPHGRFLSLFAPSLLALGALGVCRLARLAGALSRGRLPQLAVELGLGLALAIPWALLQAPRLEKLRAEGWCHFCQRVADTRRVERLATGATLRTHSLLTHDYGGPSWLSSARFAPLDFLGLCDHSAALLRSRRLGTGVGGDPRLYQYFIHEQATAPSWILVPPNFWPAFDRSPEYRWDYYPLDPKLVPNARRDSFFVLHRGELVDYFPPLPGAGFRSLGERWALVSYAAHAEPSSTGARADAEARLLVRASLVPRARVRGTERVSLRAEAGGQRSESPPIAIDRGLGIARALDRGEPLALELALTLPAQPGPYRLSLRFSETGRGAGPAVDVELGELAAGAALPPFERDLPRYPAALPAPRAPELVRLRGPVRRSIEGTRGAGRALGSDAALGRELHDVGAALQTQAEADQAYLAYVWATQVDARAWEELAEPIFTLRPPLDDEHPTEISLLRRYYASGGERQRAHLTGFYLSRRRLAEARHFLGPWTPSEAELPLAQALRAELARGEAALAGPVPPEDASALALVALDPLAPALDFEVDALDPWQGPREVFRAGPQPIRGLRGQHGAGVLSSTAAGKSARGQLTSPEFTLDGSVLSVLVGGGSAKHGTGVELLVDDAVVATASGTDSTVLAPVFWDVGAHAGKRARLRVFDRSTRDYVLADRVLLWR
jgi:hypothetical protein